MIVIPDFFGGIQSLDSAMNQKKYRWKVQDTVKLQQQPSWNG